MILYFDFEEQTVQVGRVVFDIKTGKYKKHYSEGISGDGEKDSIVYSNGKIGKIIRNKYCYEIFNYNENGLLAEWYKIRDTTGYEVKYDSTLYLLYLLNDEKIPPDKEGKWDTLSYLINEYRDKKTLKRKFWKNGINGGDIESYYDEEGNLSEYSVHYSDGAEKVICEYENGLRKREFWHVSNDQEGKNINWIYLFDYRFYL